MRREMIIDEEKDKIKVAIKEDGQLVELIAESKQERTIVGAIIKGVVKSIVPSMQAAFIDLGPGKNGFLHMADIVEEPEVYDRLFKLREERVEDGAIMVEAEPARPAGGIFQRLLKLAIGRGEVRAGEEKEPEKPLTPPPRHRPRQKMPLIQDTLKEGQELIVQVAKEAIGGKGPRLTSQVALPGRLLVLMPREDKMGVSQQIKSDEERARLRDIILRIKKPGMGLIVRTAGEGHQEEEFAQDLEQLVAIWREVNEKAQTGRGPLQLYRDEDLLQRLIRDQAGLNFDLIVANTPQLLERLRTAIGKANRSWLDKLQLHDKKEPIFNFYGISEEIDKALREKVRLKSGGQIVINQTEALVAIDVNTGKFTTSGGMREAILRTNLEAAGEVARQLKLRDIGGIVVIDFIDMDNRRDQDRVLNRLREACHRDKSRTKIYPFSKLGLVEMTRKRVRRSLRTSLTKPCQTCGGRGYML